jgi:hypothetical protein
VLNLADVWLCIGQIQVTNKQDYVECIVNAPYGTVVERLGEAGIGLNTMQDEHFGINVVEFMVS